MAKPPCPYADYLSSPLPTPRYFLYAKLIPAFFILKEEVANLFPTHPDKPLPLTDSLQMHLPSLFCFLIFDFNRLFSYF